MNIVWERGHLTRDPEMFHSGDTEICKFTIAVNDGWGNKKSTDFFDCVAFKKTASAIGQYFSKGKEIIVNGRLKQNTWEKDGRKHSKIEIIVNGFEFVGKHEEKQTDAFNNQADEGDIPW